ncbi:hypothetical protein TNCV_204681 [Trichonephila clavipes]|nr:hypothetical protein TNCV_204681 [Trichonephila clavipes]
MVEAPQLDTDRKFYGSQGTPYSDHGAIVRVVVYCASTPQVQVLLMGCARSTLPFILAAMGRYMCTKLDWGQTLEVSLQTHHLIGTSAHAPQSPLVTYTWIVILGSGRHGLLCH